MRPVSTSAIVMLLLFVLSGCLLNSNREDEPQVWPLPVALIESTTISGNSVKFDVLLSVASSGWELARTDVERTDNEFLIRFFGTPPEVGLPVMSSLPASLSMELTPGETYTFRFWQATGTTLDLVVTLPE